MRIASWLAILVAVPGCGRIAFDAYDPTGDGGVDPTGDGGGGDGGGGGGDGGVPVAGRIAWFKLDENAGMVAYDSLSTEFGFVAGGLWTPGHSGSALAFDGNGDNVGIGAIEVLANLPQLSISAWINPTSVVDDGNPHCIFAKATTTTAGWAMLIGNNGNGSVGFESYYPTVTLSKHSSANTVLASQWQHVVVTWTGGTNFGDIQIYRNGIQVTNVTGAGGTATRPDDAAISATINCYGVVGFAGAIDDVQIFNVVLTPQDVASLYTM